MKFGGLIRSSRNGASPTLISSASGSINTEKGWLSDCVRSLVSVSVDTESSQTITVGIPLIDNGSSSIGFGGTIANWMFSENNLLMEEPHLVTGNGERALFVICRWSNMMT